MLGILPQMLLGYQIKDEVCDRATRIGTQILSGNLKERHYFGKLGVYVKVIFKRRPYLKEEAKDSIQQELDRGQFWGFCKHGNERSSNIKDEKYL
jgi:hypothetical protein